MRRVRRALLLAARAMMYDAQLAADACISGEFPRTELAVWLLGQRHCALTGRDALLADLRTRLWFSYRRGFPPLAATSTDRGWGCMLRCGQMLLAEAVQRLSLGRGWRWTADSRDVGYLRLLQLFADQPSAPLSLHRLALLGARAHHEPVGTWYGPNTVGQTIRQLVDELVPDSCSGSTAEDAVPRLHVAMDGVLAREEVRRRACDTSDRWRPLLILIPLRLGLNELNPIYTEAVAACFRIPHTLGIIGGTPNHALYFVGCFGDRVVYLDPHTTQPVADVGLKLTAEEREHDCSYHCRQPSYMRITNMDPSLAVAFLCRTALEFESLCQHVQRLLVDKQKYPMFELCDTRPCWATVDAGFSDDVESAAAPAQLGVDSPDTDDEFELL